MWSINQNKIMLISSLQSEPLTELLLFIIPHTKIWNSFDASTQNQIENWFKKMNWMWRKFQKRIVNEWFAFAFVVESIMNHVRWTGSLKTHQWPKTKKKYYYFRMNVSSRDLIRYCQLHSSFVPSHSLPAFWFWQIERISFHRSFFIIIHQFFDWSGFGLWDSWAMTSFFFLPSVRLWKLLLLLLAHLWRSIHTLYIIHDIVFSKLISIVFVWWEGDCICARNNNNNKNWFKKKEKIRQNIQHWTILKCMLSSLLSSTHRLPETSYTVIFELWKFVCNV